jgi:sec-independent protein translocase protein TatC
MEIQNTYNLIEQITTRLRRRLLLLAGVLVLTSSVGYYFADDVMRHLFAMVRQVIFISPAEAFVTKLKVAITLGLTMGMPVILYLVIDAVRAYHKDIHLRHHIGLTVLSYALFAVGVLFCYFAMLPVGLNFLLNFSTLEMQPLLSAGRFMSFVLFCLFIFGVVFELPLFIMLFASLGLVSAETLRAKRRYAILAIFILAGFLAPSPDVVSQILLALPMLVLYELGIILIRFSKKAPSQEPEIPADQQQLFM